MKTFKPTPDTKWVLEVDTKRAWEPNGFKRYYIWEKIVDQWKEKKWQVAYFKNEEGMWEKCDGIVTDNPASYDDQAKFTNVERDDLFLIVL